MYKKANSQRSLSVQDSETSINKSDASKSTFQNGITAKDSEQAIKDKLKVLRKAYKLMFDKANRNNDYDHFPLARNLSYE